MSAFTYDHQQRPAAAVIAAKLATQAGQGRPLPQGLRRALETDTGHDLMDVRVHTTYDADNLADTLEARAFTAGSDIFFSAGAFDPNSSAGYRLLAHEVIHVLQRRPLGDGIQAAQGWKLDDPAGPDEERAAAHADRLLHARGPAGGTPHRTGTAATEQPPGCSRRHPIPVPAPQSAAGHGQVLCRAPADEYVGRTGLDETALGRLLLTMALAGDLATVEQVFDELGGTDQDDVSLAFMETATPDDLGHLLRSPGGRALLDRLLDQLTSGYVGDDEQHEADRILAMKSLRISPQDFEAGVQGAKVFPFKLPGLFVFSDAPIDADRRERGRIWVKQPVRNPVRHRQPSGVTATSGRPLWQQWSYSLPQAVGDKIDRHQPDPARKDLQPPADTPISPEVLIGPLPALTAGRRGDPGRRRYRHEPRCGDPVPGSPGRSTRQRPAGSWYRPAA